jgi:hypothetical protein
MYINNSCYCLIDFFATFIKSALCTHTPVLACITGHAKEKGNTLKTCVFITCMHGKETGYHGWVAGLVCSACSGAVADLEIYRRGGSTHLQPLQLLLHLFHVFKN